MTREFVTSGFVKIIRIVFGRQLLVPRGIVDLDGQDALGPRRVVDDFSDVLPEEAFSASLSAEACHDQ